jgi:two-component system, NtrC family, nitrogen regulation sensor histidine kinase NtrY
MRYKNFGFSTIARTLLMFGVLLFASYAFVKEWYVTGIIVIPLVMFLIYDYYSFHIKAKTEIEQYVESIHYRDFSRYFDVKKAPGELQPFRMGFNKINSTFKIISKEKETQFLHLKNILEIVDTGILSYDVTGGEILWMNESLKGLLQIPYLRTIQSLEKRNETLYTEVVNLFAGQKIVTSIQRDNSAYKILMSATVFESEGKTYKLIAFQNINDALDEGESMAWQKLLSVMTHEIMNSVAPISSLAETLKSRTADAILQPENYKDALTDIETGITTIKKRSEGLLRFTETYRNLSKINKVTLSNVFLLELFEHVQQLMQPNIDQKKIEFEVLLKDPTISINVDSSLIEQVLINLILNAMDALKDCALPKIILQGEVLNQRVTINIRDNGIGISEAVLDKIFVPFFSTKKNGNGIGLSLCKQVMMLHKGKVAVKSIENQGTLFTLSFE